MPVHCDVACRNGVRQGDTIQLDRGIPIGPPLICFGIDRMDCLLSRWEYLAKELSAKALDH